MSCEVFHIPGTGNKWNQFEEASLVKKSETDASKEALEIKNVKAKNYREKKRSGVIDSTAAAVILERFMDSSDFKKLKENFTEN